MSDKVEEAKEQVISADVKQMVMTVSAVLMVIGFPLSLNLICALSGGWYSSSDVLYPVFSCLAVLLTLGVGLVIFIHGNHSIQNKPSKPLYLPSVLPMVGGFFLLLLLGLFFFNVESSLFFPPILIILAALPPLWSVAWFMGTYASPDNGMSENTAAEHGPELTGLTWRRGIMAFVGGATIGVLVAIILEVLLPTLVLVLVVDLANTVMDSGRILLDALAGSNIAEAVAQPAFVYVFIQLAIIAPLAEEFAKPLALLPLLRGLNRREAFLLGALAGAGFAAVENVIYATSGQELWGGILLVRSLGGALHPLGAGLMALAWRDALYETPGSWSKWLERFAMAVGLHAVWNGGSLLVITLGSAGLFGELSREIGILGFSAAGVVLAFLIVLGIFALWVGRILGKGDTSDISLLAVQSHTSPSEQNLAIWALACLAAIVPIGIAGLRLWLR
jgi:RsiW-degrading membrane proteinase PrsW (M82 family)